MVYAALPDRRIPYDNDGTVVMQTDNYGSYGNNPTFPSGSALLGLNGYTEPNTMHGRYSQNCDYALATYFFFPEQREVTGSLHLTVYVSNGGLTIKGSNNSGNGLDGTWETASFTAISPSNSQQTDHWRTQIKPVSFTGPKKTIRYDLGALGAGSSTGMCLIHIYGEKAAGQTPDDIIYINHDDTPGAEHTAPEDFGDQPLGTTVVRQFRIKNVSATKTANTINIQCNDSDFAISTDGSTWVVTINISSLAAGAESSTMYVRCTTPAPGNTLGPRFARIVTTVASYT